MNHQVGDLVTRIKYNHDVVFKILNIKGDVAYLKGISIRLYADAPLEDLVKYQKEERIIEDDEMDLRTIEKKEFFYLPGKVLHIDAECCLSK